MRKISSPGLSQLLMQLRYTPLKKRRKQLEAAEELFNLIEKDKEYPFEFVCFRITGFSLKNSEYTELIKGQDLQEDLRVFISKLSGRIAPSLREQKEKVYTVNELAEKFGVSTKTIARWQKFGLLAEKYIFDDGLKRLGYRQSMLDEFMQNNPVLIDKAAKFSRLTQKQKQQIINRAVKLSSASVHHSLNQIISIISAEQGRSREVIRCILADYEKVGKEKAAIKAKHPIKPAEANEIYRLYQQGCKVAELMSRFNRNKSSIYRIINRKRAKNLLAQKIEYLTSDEFFDSDAREKIPALSAVLVLPQKQADIETFKLADRSMPEYLQILDSIPTLNREEEHNLFRRYNYLKYKASEQLAQIKLSKIRGSELGRIEKALAEAEDIKRRIIEANLQLVVNIARKHTGSRTYLPDLVSEGNIALIDAVEKFDYRRGLRFAGFAGWAIAREFARNIPSRSSTKTASLANMQRKAQTQEATDFAAIEKAGRSLMQVIENNLNDREKYIIIHRFGLVGPPVRKKTKTLLQIGQELRLSKERIRQLELTALKKLRQSLSPKEFELLTR